MPRTSAHYILCNMNCNALNALSVDDGSDSRICVRCHSRITFSHGAKVIKLFTFVNPSNDLWAFLCARNRFDMILIRVFCAFLLFYFSVSFLSLCLVQRKSVFGCLSTSSTVLHISKCAQRQQPNNHMISRRGSTHSHKFSLFIYLFFAVNCVWSMEWMNKRLTHCTVSLLFFIAYCLDRICG